jgi:hypothetical protein
MDLLLMLLVLVLVLDMFQVLALNLRLDFKLNLCTVNEFFILILDIFRFTSRSRV